MKTQHRDGWLVLLGTIVLDALLAPLLRELVNARSDAAIYGLAGVGVVLLCLNGVGLTVATRVWRKR